MNSGEGALALAVAGGGQLTSGRRRLVHVWPKDVGSRLAGGGRFTSAVAGSWPIRVAPGRFEPLPSIGDADRLCACQPPGVQIGEDEWSDRRRLRVMADSCLTGGELGGGVLGFDAENKKKFSTP
jgi:hypothetical protein